MPLTVDQQENAVHCLELLLSKLVRDAMPDYYEVSYCKKQLRKFKKEIEVKECQNTLTTKNLNVSADVV